MTFIFLNRFKEIVESRPNDVAILYAKRKVTFRELDILSNSIANQLNALLPLGKNIIVGVYIQRNEKLLVVLLAILKSGNAFLPIDKSFPKDLVNTYLEQSHAAALVIDEESSSDFRFKGIYLMLDNLCKSSISALNPKASFANDHTAYIFFTSGSTGMPKAVEISYGNFNNFIKWCLKEFSDDIFDVVFAGTSCSFDLSIFEIFFPLAQGKTIRLLNSNIEIGLYLKRHARVLLNTVPSVIMQLSKNLSILNSVQVLNLAGEVLQASLVQKIKEKHAHILIRNLYGPTEATTYSSCFRIKEIGELIPIGKPILQTNMHILNEALQHVNTGEIGEIFIEGANVSKGYINNTELSQKVFMKGIRDAKKRMYKTGDWGKKLPDGNILFLGRKDDQIKINGFRVEIQEVEAALQKHPNIENAAVIIQMNENSQSMTAFLLEIEKTCLIEQYRKFLSKKLPVYFIPHRFIILNIFPTTCNGKVDREKLKILAKECL